MNRNKLVPAVVLLSILYSAAIPAAAPVQTPREVAKRVLPSVVLLVVQDANGQEGSLASGFVVRQGVVATNLHTVAGGVRGYAKLVDGQTRHDIRGIVARDQARDLVLLSIANLKAPALKIGDSNAVAVGDAVYVVGNPAGLEGTFSAGVVSSIRKLGDDSLLQITAPIWGCGGNRQGRPESQLCHPLELHPPDVGEDKRARAARGTQTAEQSGRRIIHKPGIQEVCGYSAQGCCPGRCQRNGDAGRDVL